MRSRIPNILSRKNSHFYIYVKYVLNNSVLFRNALEIIRISGKYVNMLL